MKYFGIFIVVIIIVIVASVLITQELSRNGVPENSKQIKQSKEELIAADKSFYKESLTMGTGKAFIDFAADSAILMREGKSPIVGKEALKQFYKNKDTVILPLKWTPEKAEVSPDGKMGYTFGKWECIQSSDSSRIDTTNGNYAAVWQKQTGGSWKYTLYSRTVSQSKDTAGIIKNQKVY